MVVRRAWNGELPDSFVDQSQNLVPTFKDLAVCCERLPPRQPDPVIEKLLYTTWGTRIISPYVDRFFARLSGKPVEASNEFSCAFA
jgi:hypothetical protein